jgi:hypothetical protein
MLYNRGRKIDVTLYHLLFDDRSIRIEAMTPVQLAAYKRSNEYRKKKPFLTKLTTVTIAYNIKIHNLK